MNEIAVIKAQVQKAEWAERIRQCKESGLTVTAWCQQNSINSKTYYYHLRKIRNEICEQIAVPVMSVQENCPTVKIHMGDAVAEIPEGVSEQTVTSVIKAIRNA